jgi:hypothetical protein
MRWFMRGLCVGHALWGLVLVLIASYVTRSAFSVLGYLSSGTVWTNLPMALILTVQLALPLALLGAWMLILARRLWSGRRPVRTALFVTHGILVAPGVLAIVIGIYALRAAEASAAKGGGLLGAWGFIPLGIGICIVALALPSVVLALMERSKPSDSTGK